MTIAAKCDKCKNYTNFCICGEIVNSSIGETWTKTMDLRWWSNPKLGMLNYLQQKHISNLGNEKWVDVESVTI